MHTPKEWFTYFDQKPNAASYGGVEALCIGLHDPALAASAWLRAVGHTRVGTPGETHALASSCTVFVSPDAPADIEERVMQAVVSGVSDEDAQKQIDAIQERVHVLRANTLDGRTLIERMERLDGGPHPFVLVLDADRYETGVSARAPDGVDIDAWLWADRLARLGEACVEVSRRLGGAVYLLSSRFAPYDARVRDRVLGVEGIGIAMVAPPYAPDSVPGLLPHLLAGVRDGGLDDALHAIDDLGLDHPEAASVRAQAFQAAGRPGDAYDQIEPYLDILIGTRTQLLLAKYARICQLDERPEQARRFLGRLAELDPADEVTLTVAAGAAEGIGDDETAAAFYARLDRLFPNADATLNRAFFAAATPADFAVLADRVAPRLEDDEASQEARFIATVARSLRTPDGLESAADLEDLFEAVREIDPALVASASTPVAMQILARGRPLLAAQAALAWTDEPNGPPERGRARVLLRALDALFARMGSDDALTQPMVDTVVAALRAIAGFIWRHPESSLRLDLAALASPRSGGAYGLTFLSAALNTAPLGIVGRWAPPPQTHPPDDIDDQVLALVERLYQMAAPLGVLPVGHGELPDLGSLDGRTALDHVRRQIKGFAGQDSGDNSRQAVLSLLHAGVLLAREVGEPGEAYEVATIAGAVLSTLGFPQAVRDLAEQVFLFPVASADDRIEAWLAHADLYLRVHRPEEALTALLVASTDTDRPWRPSTAYHVCLLRARACRDLGFEDAALDAVDRARAIAEVAGTGELVRERLDAVADGVQLRRVLSEVESLDPEASRTQLESFSAHLVERLAAVVDDRENPLPTASLLAGLLEHMETAGADLEPARRALRRAAEAVDGHAARTIRSLADGAGDVGALVPGLGETRHAEDASTDVVVARQLARRALAGGPDSAPETASHLEWLADRSVRPVGSADAADGSRREDLQRRVVRSVAGGGDRPRDREALYREALENPPVVETTPPLSSDDLDDLARRVGDRGAEIVAFGIARDARLVTASYREGAIVTSWSEDDEFSQAFETWRRTYPKGYQVGTETAGYDIGAFEGTLRGLALPVATDGGTIIAAPEANLQSLPPNLVTAEHRHPVDGPLVALRRPTAAVPSLTWLRSSLEAGSVVSGARVAWVPTPAAPPPDRLFSELEVLRDSVAPTLAEHGFSIHTTDAVPALHEAGVAVVGAHGGVHALSSVFRAVSDDENLVISSQRVSSLIGGATVVVLFVCHGGRLDPHPRAVATVGLATRLLDEGSRAVVASPWPLDLSVPQYWLPAFFSSWTQGADLARSVYEANRAVAARYSQHPSNHLAMNLTGDPFLTLATHSA